MPQESNIQKYKHWDVYEVLAVRMESRYNLWLPTFGYDFCTDGKSILNGGKRALVKSIREGDESVKFIEKKEEKTKTVEEEPKKEDLKNQFIFPSKTVNILARKKFQEQLLKEIKFDLIVCEIEGWDKKGIH